MARLVARPSVVVGIAALAAVALRFPGLLAPLGADESGFTLVARAWDPGQGNLYGDYWVARPPTLIALVKLSDLVGGAMFLRVLGAIGCGVVVLAAAAIARQAVTMAGSDDTVARRTGAWVAVLTAALTSHALVDPVSTKGELLGIPFVATSFWLVLRAVNRERMDRAAVAATFLAGVSGALALGMKQNMGAGLAFGLVVLVGSRLSGRLTTRSLVRLVAAGAGGAALPVAAVVAWTVAAGVDLGELWYAVYGFRSDTLEVLAGDATGGSPARALALFGIALATGMVPLLVAVALHGRRVWRRDRVLLVAAIAVLAVDVVGMVLSGQYWRPYLFVLVPDLALCAALLLATGAAAARLGRVLVVAAAASSLVSLVVWTWLSAAGSFANDDVASGRAVGAAAAPGDTIVSYGGAADLVLASGLDSPYPYRWSLQMRTRDPELTRLRDLLAGPRAPTWVVMLAPSYSWQHLGDAIRPVLEERYDVHGRVCNGRYVWLLSGLDRAPVRADCG